MAAADAPTGTPGNARAGAAVEAFGHRFENPGLLRQALSHRSVGHPHNERLEFLGDSLVGAIVAELLHERFPRATEGQLTRLRASLVRRESLAEQARQLNFGDHLRLGQGELKSGGFRRESILADAFEALVAAIYLDAGWQVCRQWLRQRFEPALEGIDPRQGNDPKSRLQEWLQGRNRALPDYVLIDNPGLPHSQSFQVECRLDSGQVSQGQAPTRKKAEQQAAREMLTLLGLES